MHNFNSFTLSTWLMTTDDTLSDERAQHEMMNNRLKEAFDFVKYVFRVDELYEDQISLIKAFCHGKNIFFNAPTGYGKSLVYQSLPWMLDILNEQTLGFSTLLVVSPLQSLMEDQCHRTKEVGISSVALYSANAEDESVLRDVQEGIYSVVYASPECLLAKKKLRRILSSDEFRDHCIGIACDEAHVISQWGSDIPGKNAFRKWYSELYQFKHLLNPSINFALFTATATKQTKNRIVDMLEIDVSQTFFIERSPERENIKYCVEYVDNTAEISNIFSSIVCELIEKRDKSSRYLIYAQTRNQCATIFNVFCSELKEKNYIHKEADPKCRLVDMFHGGTPDVVKKYIVSQMTLPNSCLRVVICTVAFGMGVDCKNVNECIHFGAPKSLEEYVQESGRIGRNGAPSTSRILYNAMLLKSADQQVRQYVKTTECRRHHLMQNFANYVPKRANKCHCCDNCAKICGCSPSCTEWAVMNLNKTNCQQEFTTRPVTFEQKKQLHQMLVEFRERLIEQRRNVLPSIQAEFHSFHVNQIVTKCHLLLSLKDIYHHVEIWRKIYALNILSILHNIFGDVDEVPDCIDLMDIDQSVDSLPEEWISIRDDSEAGCLSFWDSDMLQSFEDCSKMSDEKGCDAATEHSSVQLFPDES